MDIITPGMVMIMSAIVAIRTANKCLLFADKRKVVRVDEGYMLYDDAHKLFRPNKNLAVAVTGSFAKDEKFDAPFAEVDRLRLDVDSVCEQIRQSWEKKLATGERLQSRTYYAGGINRDGEIALKYISLDSSSWEIYTGSVSKDSDAILVSFPPGLENEKEELMKEITSLLTTDNGESVRNKVFAFIQELSEKSKMVNAFVESEEISKQ